MQGVRSGLDDTVSDRTDTLRTRLHILGGSRLFADLPSDAMETLALNMKQLQAAPDEAIFTRTDEGSALFGILEGQVRIVIGGIDGREQVLRVLGPSEMFGEIAALDGGPRSADAIAVTNCRLLLLERRSLLALITSQPAVAIGLIAILCERLRDTTNQIEGLLFHTLSERLASALLSLRSDKTSASINVTQTELGHLTGVTRESVNKKLRAWQAAGLVALQPGRVRIMDAEGLKRLLPPLSRL
jgi:CRP/FNR family cyclic AMP-dependent transcriptional regulator